MLIVTFNIRMYKHRRKIITDNRKYYKKNMEWQRDRARKGTFDAVLKAAKDHSGDYDIGIQYAKATLGGHAGEAAL